MSTVYRQDMVSTATAPLVGLIEQIGSSLEKAGEDGISLADGKFLVDLIGPATEVWAARDELDLEKIAGPEGEADGKAIMMALTSAYYSAQRAFSAKVELEVRKLTGSDDTIDTSELSDTI